MVGVEPGHSRLPPEGAAVDGLAPFVHVADVERSLAFYEQLGLVRGDTMDDEGRLFWGSMHSGQAHIMFALAEPLVEADLQGVLFYLYSDDIVALRAHLVGCGLRESTDRSGPVVPEPKGVVFPIAHPEYMPAGELRVHDPDGYCLLIGQRE
jgi:catechol 2,3-dioxygenase-like lactoylglutathione lyase family enzyme